MVERICFDAALDFLAMLMQHAHTYKMLKLILLPSIELALLHQFPTRAATLKVI